MHKAAVVRNEIAPLLDQLIYQLGAEGRATPRAHFNRIRKLLYRADTTQDLASPLINLCSSVVLGFRLSADSTALLERLMNKSQHLMADLDGSHITHH